jgi:hypothetical protein
MKVKEVGWLTRQAVQPVQNDVPALPHPAGKQVAYPCGNGYGSEFQ